MLKQQKSNKILLLLSVCIMLTMLLQVAYAADYTINITQQPTSSLTGVFGESPGTILVEATTTNGAPITYQWWCKVSGSNMTVGNGTNTFEISSDLIPGTYEYYCELKAEGCDAIESERTTVTVNKATYTGIQSDTFYVKADQPTLNNEYTLPNVPMSDVTYTIEDNGGTLVTGTRELKRDASTDWRWILIFNTASKPAGTEEDIILKINGGYCYNDSSFTLTVKAGKQPVSITGIDGTDAEYSGNPQKGYTGVPQTGGFTGALNHHYNGRNTTAYDSGTAPIDVGDYTVTLSIPEDADYSGSKSIDFSIKKKEVRVWPVNYTMPQGETLPTSDSIYVNYIGFVAGDNSNNSISTWAVPKLNVSDSNTPGESDIDFETEATLVTEKEKHYTLKHEKGELTIQARTYFVAVIGSYAPTSGEGDYYLNDTVNIAAGTRDGYTFVNWTSPDGVSFANPDSASTTFTMPGKDVTVTANRQQVAPTKYTVTFNANGGSVSPASAQTGIDGKLTALPIPTRSNHSFDGWFTAESGGTKVTTETLFTINTTIYAHWTYSGSSSGSGSKGGSSTPTTTPIISVSDTTATITITSTMGSNKKATATFTQSHMSEALKKAQKAAANTGKKPRVKINLEKAKDAKTMEATIPGASIKEMVSGGIASLTISGGLGSITFDEASINTISKAALGNVTISMGKADASKLSDAAKNKVGNRPLYDFTVICGGKTISQFGGAVTVAIPYTPAADEDTNAIVIYYINDKGELETITNGRYDAATGTVIFTTDHFSIYAVGYNKVQFGDVSNTAWYAKSVSYISARGITSKIAEGNFDPDAILTRGQFITMLLRAYSISPDEKPAQNFADAGNTYYTGYLAAAKHLDISRGVGGNRFAPDKAVTRQEMFTMLYNALNVMGKLPDGNLGKALADFYDSGSIAAWAKDAMAYLVKTGTINGSSGKLAPAEATTRAQMAQVLYNLMVEQ